MKNKNKLHKCENFECIIVTNNKKFCSRKCYQDYCKQHKIGFYSFEVQSKNGKKGGKTIDLEKYSGINAEGCANTETGVKSVRELRKKINKQLKEKNND